MNQLDTIQAATWELTRTLDALRVADNAKTAKRAHRRLRRLGYTSVSTALATANALDAHLTWCTENDGEPTTDMANLAAAIVKRQPVEKPNATPTVSLSADGLHIRGFIADDVVPVPLLNPAVMARNADAFAGDSLRYPPPFVSHPGINHDLDDAVMQRAAEEAATESAVDRFARPRNPYPTTEKDATR